MISQECELFIDSAHKGNSSQSFSRIKQGIRIQEIEELQNQR